MIELFKILICLPFLLYASYSDIKTRRVSNDVWKLMIVAGSPFILYEIIVYGLSHIIHLMISFGFIFVFVYILFYLNAFGGADAKAFMVIALIIPSYPIIDLLGQSIPIYGPPFIDLFAFSVFTNSIILTIVVPLGLFIYNLIKVPFSEVLRRPFYLFIGYMHPISELRDRHLKLIEKYDKMDDGTIKTSFSRSGTEINHENIRKLETYSKNGLIGKRVWVTPGLPFMIPITAGFISAVLLGDIIFHLTLNYLV